MLWCRASSSSSPVVRRWLFMLQVLNLVSPNLISPIFCMHISTQKPAKNLLIFVVLWNIYLYISTQKPAENEILLHSELKINLADRLMQCKHSCSMNVCVVIYSHDLLAWWVTESWLCIQHNTMCGYQSCFSFSSLCIILCFVGRSKELKNLNYTEWCKGTLDNTVSTLQSLPSA